MDLFACFDHDRRVVAHADLGIEDGSRGTFPDEEDTCLIALNESRRIRIVREVVATIGAAGILD